MGIGKRLFMRKWDRRYWKLGPGVGQEIVLVKKTDESEKGKLWIVAQPDFSLVTIDVGVDDKFRDSPIMDWPDDADNDALKKKLEEEDKQRRLNACSNDQQRQKVLDEIKKEKDAKDEELKMKYLKVPKLRLAMRMRLESTAEQLIEEGLIRACLLDQAQPEYV